MEVKLDKRYPIAVDAERAWRVLGDLHALASCMPGAELTEQLSDTRFKGRVTVKVGPAVASFGGEVERVEIDPAAHRVRLNAKGADKGGSSAAMDLTAAVEAAAGGSSVLVGTANVIVNGKFAQFGGRMMGQVSDIILAQFAANFATAAGALPMSATASAISSSPSVADAAAATTATSSPVALARAKELNALRLLWQLVKGWLNGLFGKRPGTRGG